MMQLPSSFDLRFNHNLNNGSSHVVDCLAFKPQIIQGSCNACVAASLATILSIQACLGKQDPNITYSAQQIWDCYDGSCALGVHTPLMDTFFPYVLNGPSSGQMFSSMKTNVEMLSESNYTRCFLSTTEKAPLLAVQGHSTRHIKNLSTASAVSQMKQHIYTTGPIMAIVRMTDPIFQAFLHAHGNNTFSLGMPGHILHALAVIGWRDIDGAWLVQNSMGPSWQNQGIGWVTGQLEMEWYGFQLDVPSHQEYAGGVKKKQEVHDKPFITIVPNNNNNNNNAAMIDQLDVIVSLITFMSMGFIAWILFFSFR